MVGGASEVLPIQKGGGVSFSHAEGWGHKSFRDNFNMRTCSFSHTEGEGARSFHPLKGESQEVLPCLDGGGGWENVSDSLFPILTSKYSVDVLHILGEFPSFSHRPCSTY